VRESTPEEREQAKFNEIVLDLRRKHYGASDDEICKLATAQMNQNSVKHD
jgi:hypothetical protein